MAHTKIDSLDGSRFYCDDVLMKESIGLSNVFCQECPICGGAFSTHGSPENGLNVVYENLDFMYK